MIHAHGVDSLNKRPCTSPPLTRMYTSAHNAPQMRLDLDLPAQLVLDAALEELGLPQHLERHDILGAPLPG